METTLKTMETNLLWSKKRDVTDRGVQPPLVQKRDRYQQGGPTDLLWSKKRDRFQQGGPTSYLKIIIAMLNRLTVNDY